MRRLGPQNAKSRAIEFSIAACSLGRLLVAATERGLCHIRFGEDDDRLEEELRAEFPFAPLRRDDRRLRRYREALVRYVDGRATDIDLPLDVSGSRFQRRVWAALRRIPRGGTRSYSAIAESLGMPTGARAVARACATNPVPILIPCHRVIAKDGGIGGYGAGVERKRALLEHEARRRRPTRVS